MDQATLVDLAILPGANREVETCPSITTLSVEMLRTTESVSGKSDGLDITYRAVDQSPAVLSVPFAVVLCAPEDRATQFCDQ